MARADTQLTGSAGEFFVAGELARRKWVPSITPRGIERTDIMAQHSETRDVIAVQVKTANPNNAFRLGPKAEAPAKQWTEWFIFVALREPGERPRFFIVPTNIVAAIVYVGHRAWLAAPGRGGRKRQDSNVRAIGYDEITPYEERWDLLESGAKDAPVWLLDWVIERGNSDIGWPEGHPGFGAVSPLD